jgi:hypothetical protein
MYLIRAETAVLVEKFSTSYHNWVIGDLGDHREWGTE